MRASEQIIILGAPFMNAPTTPSWLPLASGVAPTLFADFTTEGTSNHYWYNNASYGSFAAWNTAIGGTFSRASAAGYMQSGVYKSALSNAARFPSDINGNPTGLRLTGAGTNLLRNSQVFTGANWVKDGNTATLVASGVGPDGVSSAYLFTEPGSGASTYGAYQALSGLTSGTPYTIYAIMKAGTRNYVYLNLQASPSNNFISAVYDLDLGVVGETKVGTNSGTIISNTIKALANGWYLIALTGSIGNATGNNCYAVIEGAPLASGNTWTTGGQVSYTANGSSFSYGAAQVTASAFPLDYIPTTTTTVTQAADALTLPFSAASTFTAVAKATMAGSSSSGRLIGVGSGKLINQSDSTDAQTDNGTNNISAAISAWTSANKVGATGTGSARAIAANNNAAVGDANALLAGAITNLYPMSDNGSNQSYGDLASIAAWNGLSVSNSTLQGLTL